MNQMEKNSSFSADPEKGLNTSNIITNNGEIRTLEPRKFTRINVQSPQPDYMNWSTASIFICFIWGVFAFIASNKVRKYNQMEAYDEAHYYSQYALRLNKSALACFIVIILIIAVPLAISLIVQGSISKFPNARTFFG